MALRPVFTRRALLVVGLLSGVHAACGHVDTRSAARRPAMGGDAGGGGAPAAEAGACADCETVAGQAGIRAGGGLPGTGSFEGGGHESGGAAGGEAQATPRLVLSAVSITQTLEIPLMLAGQSVAVAERTLPLLAGKRALLRAFLETPPEFEPRTLIGVLDLKGPDGTDTFVSERWVGQSSKQDELESTFVFDIEARDLALGTSYYLRVLEADTTRLLRFPEASAIDLGAQATQPLELVLVPMVANGFLPNLDGTYVRALERRLLALYPLSRVQVSVREPVNLPYKVAGDVTGWDDALDAVYELRDQDAPADQVFYYGMLAPAATYDDYCPASDCIVGYSVVGDPSDVYFRGSLGVTVFPDGTGASDAWDTLAHELGHALGRGHSFCGGPNDPDSKFPYPDGGLGGIYGFDFEAMALVRPHRHKDVMGYCAPVWIADFTYRALFERFEYIAGTRFHTLSLSPQASTRVARIGHSGASSWKAAPRRALEGGRLVSVPLLDAAGRELGVIQARAFSLDHGPGGYVWLSAGELTSSGAFAIDLTALGGSLLAL